MTKHGKYKHIIYDKYRSMKRRCYNPKYHQFHRYGGRGITVCKEWLDDFMNFYNWSIENGWGKDLTLDRIDNDLNYEPSNCRWTVDEVQDNNRSNSRKIEIFGEIKSFSQWSRDKRCKTTLSAFHRRIQRNWNPEEALTTPSNKQNNSKLPIKTKEENHDG